jgi:hypothetical protein
VPVKLSVEGCEKVGRVAMLKQFQTDGRAFEGHGRDPDLLARRVHGKPYSG